MTLNRRIFELCCLLLIMISSGVRAATWPFDQRQVLLVSIEGTQFPDALTSAQIMDVFVERGRVRWITQKGGPGEIIPFTSPRDFDWSRGSAVRSLGLRYKADGIVVLIKKDSKIDMRWYSVSDGSPLYFESLYLPGSSGTVEQDTLRKDRLRAWLLDIWGKIPGRGYVVKRDMKFVFVEGVDAEGLKVGDRLKLLRLEEAKRHPILKTLVGFESSETGFATVTEIGDPFAKASIDFESELDPIQDGDRYSIVPQEAKKEAPSAKETSEKPSVQKVLDVFNLGDGHILDLKPRVGIGFLKYQESTAADSYEMRTLSYSAGFDVDLYITKAWSLSVSHDFGTGKFGSPPSDYAVSSIGSGWTNTHVLTGYSMSLGEYAGLEGGFLNFYGGYSKFNIKLEDGSAAVSPTAKTYSGISMGVDIGMPLAPKWSTIVALNRVFGAFMAESVVTSGASSGDSLWGFELIANYEWDKKADIGGSFAVVQASSTFDGSGTRATPAVSSKATSSRFTFFYKMKM